MNEISKVCRACLTVCENTTYELFENVSADLFYYCTSIKLYKDEKLPKVICEICHKLLVQYSEFKNTCITSQNALLGLKKSVKNESTEADTSWDDDNDYGNLYIDKNENEEKRHNDYQNVVVKVEKLHPEYNGLPLQDFNAETIVEDIKPKERKLKIQLKLQGNKRKKKNIVKQKNHFIFTCDICNKKFNYLDRFQAHKLEHEGKVTSIFCQPCNKTFVTWSGLRRHKENEHTQVKLESLKCKVCGKLSKNKHTLKVHERIHGERPLLMCDVCGKGFTTAVILKTHLETHNEHRERRFTCEQCGRKFLTQTVLHTHVARRHSDRRYICHVCDQPFIDKYNLAQHLIRHNSADRKYYKCDVCDKLISSQSNLTLHMRIHSGERPYNCTYCPKTFISRKNLREHIRTHTGERPYRCAVCDQEFSQSSSMKRHSKIHERQITTN